MGRLSTGIIALGRARPPGPQHQGAQLWWDNQMASPVLTGPPQINRAVGGVIGGTTWTDEFGGTLAAWHLDPAMHVTSGPGGVEVQLFFEIGGGAIYGPDAWQHWISDGYTTINSATRNDEFPAGGSQFVELDVIDMWQHADPPGPNIDSNLRGRVFAITHYDPATGAHQWALLEWDNWNVVNTPPVLGSLLVNSSHADDFVRPYGHPIDGPDIGDQVFRFEAYADGHQVVLLNGVEVLTTASAARSPTGAT